MNRLRLTYAMTGWDFHISPKTFKNYMPSSHWQVHNSVHCERAKNLKWKMKGAIVYMEVWNTRELVVSEVLF